MTDTTTLPHRLGKKKAKPEQVKLSFNRYQKAILLPKIPPTFGHQDLLRGQQLGVLGNDEVGDCVQAGTGHIVMDWFASRNQAVGFSMDNVIRDYSDSTGYVPGDANTDQGTDMSQYADYWHKTGVLDAAGNRHLLGAYLRLNTGSLDQVNASTYFFGNTGLGVQLPETAMSQFDAGQPWDVAPRGTQNLGGHFVPLVGFDGSMYYVVTWGSLQAVTPAFLGSYMDEALAYLSDDILKGGLSIDGFNMDQLRSDLSLLG